MIKNIIEMLKSQNHYGNNDLIEVAKGRYELPTTFSTLLKQIKRRYKTTRKIKN